MSTPVPLLPDPEQWQKTFQRWWATCTSIVGTVASALGALRIPSPWANGIAVVVTAVGVTVSVLIYRRQARQLQLHARVDTAAESPQQVPVSAAFRGLRRFRAGEQLPGAARRRAAGSLLAEVQRPSFDLAIVTGDSGAGKSSLLECALVEFLQASGYVVEFISDLGALLPLGEASNGDESAAVEAMWTDIRSRIVSRRTDSHSDRAVVLILDQFEELLSRLPIAAREALGDKLREALAENWRVVVGIRKDFLAELKEVAARLGRPLSLQDTFILRNFDVSEAAQVIRECAARDHISIDDELPDLIAADLTVDGAVRPPDIQIVCEVLQSEMTVDKYRRERRASGLRSRFIKDTVELTGDPVLARAVLRELCDLPNNKKRPDPVGVAALVEKARTSAPGERATLKSVEEVLTSLYHSYVVVRIKRSDETLWSLIHDYIVEPIKLATEEQATRSEAAGAELDYFLSEVANGRIRTIPLPRLTEIKSHAPPAQLSQNAARRLIRRSTFWGYARPTLLVTAIAVASLASVILLAADWDTWRPYGTPLSHWERTGARDRGQMEAFGPMSSSSHLLVLQSGTFPDADKTRITVWDGESGNRINAYSGSLSISNGHIWSYDSKTGRLSRLTVGKENDSGHNWTLITPTSNRPALELAVIGATGEPPETVIFQTRLPYHETAVWLAVLNVTARTWKVLMRSEVLPNGDESESSPWDYANSSDLHAVLVRNSKIARLRIFSHDYDQSVLDEQFDTAAVSLLGVLESDHVNYLSLVVDRQAETIPIRRSETKSGGTPAKLEMLATTKTALPTELSWKPDGWNSGVNMFHSGEQFLLVESPQTSSIIWPFDPVTAKFGDPIIAAAPAPDFWPHGTFFWSPKGKKGTMTWPEGSSTPFWLPHVELQSTDRITVTKDRTRLLLVHTDNSAELWEIDEHNGIDRLLTTIGIPDTNLVEMSSDEHLIIARQDGGIFYGWGLDGKSIGTFGPVGSNVALMTYDAACKRLFMWTQEGRRLQWRFGTYFPFYGFRPAHRCVAGGP